jgi:hypothetical protein
MPQDAPQQGLYETYVDLLALALEQQDQQSVEEYLKAAEAEGFDREKLLAAAKEKLGAEVGP